MISDVFVIIYKMEKILDKEDYNYETPSKKINAGMLLFTFNLQFKK